LAKSAFAQGGASQSRPIGFVISRTTVSNQDGTPVMEFISKGIFPRGQG
jgi:hypothetical protein